MRNMGVRIPMKFNFEVTTLESLTIFEALQDVIYNDKKSIRDQQDAAELYDKLKLKIRSQIKHDPDISNVILSDGREEKTCYDESFCEGRECGECAFIQ